MVRRLSKSPETEKAFKDRITRIKDAIQMKKLPDRVPVLSIIGFSPAYYAGITPQEVMYDYDKFTKLGNYLLGLRRY